MTGDVVEVRTRARILGSPYNIAMEESAKRPNGRRFLIARRGPHAVGWFRWDITEWGVSELGVVLLRCGFGYTRQGAMNSLRKSTEDPMAAAMMKGTY